MRFTPLFVVVLSTLLPAVFSIPVVAPEAASEISIAKRGQDLSLEVIQRDLLERFQRNNNPGINSRDIDAAEAIYRRVNPNRKAEKAVKKAAKALRVNKAAAKGKVGPKRPSNAKVTFGSAARAKLDELNLHGKDRKKAKKYHKNIVKQDMKKHGADSARVFHLAHTGGTDPNERNHITAGYYKKPTVKGQPGEQIKSPWAVKHEAENPGKTTKGLFHVYPEDQTRKTKVPSAWTNAAAASATRKQAEADRVAAQAAAEARAKEERVRQDKTAGQSLSKDDKKAQREAAKAAKLAKKKGGPSG